MLQTRRGFIKTLSVLYDQIGNNRECWALSINPSGLINVGANGTATFRKLGTIFIERKRINYSNNTKLMADEPPHSIYKRDTDTDLPKEMWKWYNFLINKIKSVTTIKELNLIKYNPIWQNVLNNRNDIKELFNKKWLELNKNE
ncbi:hypothetical protein [Spiroplasma endosymbiont of Ammophila pubescens]|uniref:hypothetical protein n=1 Tax=Spiroplasma endosymbiont of Ammophila pubescens TaxID=3066315 RepID=UPI0032B1DE9A